MQKKAQQKNEGRKSPVIFTKSLGVTYDMIESKYSHSKSSAIFDIFALWLDSYY